MAPKVHRPRGQLALACLCLLVAFVSAAADPTGTCSLNCEGAFAEPNFKECLDAAVERFTNTSTAPPTVVYQGDPDYDDARRVNMRFNPMPLAVFYAHQPEHVQAAVNCGRKWSVPVSAAAGRHNYQGDSVLSGGLTVDVSNMTKVEIDTTDEVVRVGPGVTGGMLTTALHFEGPPGAVFPSGVCPWVGVSGYTLGGGVSMLSRYLGLGCDQLVDVTMVDAAGDFVTGSKTENSDLLWASCGGGGGTFGIVTEFKFRLRTLPNNGTVTKITLSYAPGADNIVQAFEKFQDWLPNMDKRFGSYIEWQGGAMNLWLVFVGDKEEAMKQLQPTGLLSVPMRPGGEVVEQLPSYWDWLRIQSEAFWLADVPDDIKDAEDWRRKTLRGEPGFRVNHGGYSNRFWIMSQTRMPERVPLEAVQRIADYIVEVNKAEGVTPEVLDSSLDVRTFGIWIWVLGGAVADVAPEDTAFFNRKSWYVMEGHFEYEAHDLKPPSAAEGARYIDVVQGYMRILEPYLPARQPSYVNYMNPPMANFGKAYWGGNYERLAVIKQKYDPLNVFTKAQTVQPTGNVTTA